MEPAPARLRGLTFAKQFPNRAEPLRGVFVAAHVEATAAQVDWEVIAPVPWVPKLFSSSRRPYVRGVEDFSGVRVEHPVYGVLPRRMLYSTLAWSVARGSASAFTEALRRARPQFVHAHALYPSGAAALRLSSSAGLPLVVTVHGSDLYANLVRRSWREHLKRVVAGADAVVCVSRALARDVTEQLGADPARVIVIPNTYDTTRFQRVSRAPAAGRPLRLASVARLARVKGVDVLLRALADARSQGLDATLTVVGDGVEKRRLVSLAESLGISGVVTFAGPLGPEALGRVLAEADVYVQPSRAEGFGVALVEAIATGLPAIATDSGGPADILTAGTGLLVEPGSVESLAVGLLRARALSETADGDAIARATMARYSPSSVGGTLVELYRDVLARTATQGIRARRA